MRAQKRFSKTLLLAVLCCTLPAVAFMSTASALNPAPIPDPVPGSYGLEATKKQPPPTTGATISIPGSGASFSNSPITVSGICPNDLLVQIYNNGVMVGAVNCQGGSFSLQVSLFPGQNELSAIVYDSLGQAGPESNIVSVIYNDVNFVAFGAFITLTSNFGRRATAPGATLTWPLQLSGGSGPYAFSIDWGDGTPADLKSQSVAGDLEISHVYKQSGLYRVTVKVTDVNGMSAFLQLLAVANGNVTTTSVSADGSSEVPAASGSKVMWIPTLVSLILLIPAYFVGRRSQLFSLRKKMERDVANFKSD